MTEEDFAAEMQALFADFAAKQERLGAEFERVWSENIEELYEQ